MTHAPLALSIGDPAGIGPELIAAAWLRRSELHLPPCFVAGGAEILREACATMGWGVRVAEIASPAKARACFDTALPVLKLDNAIENAASYSPASPHPDGARLALASLQAATQSALSGQASALVTAPVAKAELQAIGFEHPGQTEFLADACGLNRDDAVMMLAGPSVRAVPLTVHVALADVPARLTTDLIVHRGRIVAKALQRDFGIANPRLAVAGLNPHAGEGGAFGEEEARIITPAIAALQADGIAATGPHPADALFAPRGRAGFDAALCMYHDQALIPVKTLDFDEGVNVTLGLPIIRTSPDHGTAFDIAGTGAADPGALIAAMRMAADCAARRSG